MVLKRHVCKVQAFYAAITKHVDQTKHLLFAKISKPSTGRKIPVDPFQLQFELFGPREVSELNQHALRVN